MGSVKCMTNGSVKSCRLNKESWPKGAVFIGSWRVPETVGVHPEMVDFGFRQGPSEFLTAYIVRYFED
jgi:hypothetical protein